METFLFGQWWRSRQSLACKGLRIFKFCVMFCKGESEPTIKYCLGRQVDVVQKFITIQNFGHNYLHLQKDSQQDVGHSSDLDQKRSDIFYLYWQTTRRMGQSRWIDDDQIQRKRTPSFPSHESIVPRNAQKQRRWTIIDTLLCRWGYDWNCFRTIISVNQLSIYGAVSDLCEEYSSCQTRTGRLVLERQSDQLFESKSSLMKTPTPSTDDPAQEDVLQKYQERVERLSQQNRVFKICTDAGFLITVEVGQYRRRRKRGRRSNKKGETREWATNRFVHTARGNRHWLQSVGIATCSCERSRKLPRSRAREEDRESSSSRSTSSRLAAK